MANSEAENAYPEVHDILMRAYDTEQPTEVEYPTEALAIKFVSRCGTFRRLMRKQSGICKYDSLRISRVGAVVTIMPWMQTLPIVRNAVTGEVIDLKPEFTRAEMDAMVEEERQKQRTADERDAWKVAAKDYPKREYSVREVREIFR
jgi:hypothetical protein